MAVKLGGVVLESPGPKREVSRWRPCRCGEALVWLSWRTDVMQLMTVRDGAWRTLDLHDNTVQRWDQSLACNDLGSTSGSAVSARGH